MRAKQMLELVASRFVGNYEIGLTKLTNMKKVSKFVGSQLSVIDNLRYFSHSPSQLGQDLLAHLVCESRFFVEFGACDGRKGSNTLWLEKSNGWSGILAEPGKVWHQKLNENRSARLIKKAISGSAANFRFAETPNPSYSTFLKFVDMDVHAKKRSNFIEYSVESISLLDLLVEGNAPKNIGYLSIDTEGSEFEILERFNFDSYSFEFITVEHNFNSNKQKIDDLLISNGYAKVLEEISGGDGWYINAFTLNRFPYSKER